MLKRLFLRWFLVDPYVYLVQKKTKDEDSLLPAYLVGVKANILFSSMAPGSFPKDTTRFYFGYVTRWPNWFARLVWAFLHSHHKQHWTSGDSEITYELEEFDNEKIKTSFNPKMKIWVNGVEMMEMLLENTQGLTQFSFMLRRNDIFGDYSKLFMTDSFRKADAMTIKMIIPSS